MSGNGYMRPEDVLALLLKQIVTAYRDRIGEIQAHLAAVDDARWVMDDGRVMVVQCKRWPAVSFSGSVAASPATVSGSVATVMFPELPADHLAEVRKQVISGQLFLMILITLIVFAIPAAVLASDLPPDAQAVMLAYEGVLAAYAAAYMFSDRRKRK